MMPIVYNTAGAIIIAVAAAVGVAARLGAEELGCAEAVSLWVGFVTCAVVVIVTDIGWRVIRPEPGLGRLIWPSTGGMIMYAPVWAPFVVFGFVWSVQLARALQGE